ncbi:ROK family transcriptional regulator [Alteribacillus bidgolensis]|uniref:Sugar kinase of the NBD/HSP70 family, may contain an N-terminal HTH domain n=1 Tax=Alteribacillus bidgolensis TaxID=930129 RepID=A0A1G8FN03_9BACI|nr:ROK family transcriptional regulator [Alteribacillus bidgolensis]SDH83366.1 Sugar kinase of the NBD/HSP70 family, may contain an N-terminal HTH domain [Alteribacillus bidgolensis]
MVEEFLRQRSSKFNGMKEVYCCIHQHGLITKAELLKRTNMKQTTVVRHLDALIQYGLIRIEHYEESSGGRPPALYAIDPKAAFIIGIDLSRVETAITIVDMSFAPVANYTFQMTEDHTPAYTISVLKKEIAALLKDNEMEKKDILGIGLGTVGPLDRQKGIMYPEAFVAPGWNEVPIVHEIKQAFQTDVFLENGANTAALYESINNPEFNKTILYCISGWGLRCGVLTNGTIMQSRKGDASSFGEMIIDTKSNRTLSSYISYNSILEEAEKKINAGEKTIHFYPEKYHKKNEKMDHLLHALMKGDPLIENVVLQSAYYFGVGIANMVNVLHPEVVVLNSDLIRIYPAFYEKVVKTAETFIFQLNKQHLHFHVAQPTANAVSIGACVLAFQSHFK